VSPLCSRNARSQKTLVGRAQWGTHPGHHRECTRASLEGPSLVAHGGLAWDKARPRAKSLSWQTQGRRVK
jgi:hypothetical protein